jgi:hypothetical protein
MNATMTAAELIWERLPELDPARYEFHIRARHEVEVHHIPRRGPYYLCITCGGRGPVHPEGE